MSPPRTAPQLPPAPLSVTTCSFVKGETNWMVEEKSQTANPWSILLPIVQLPCTVTFGFVGVTDPWDGFAFIVYRIVFDVLLLFSPYIALVLVDCRLVSVCVVNLLGPFLMHFELPLDIIDFLGLSIVLLFNLYHSWSVHISFV